MLSLQRPVHLPRHPAIAEVPRRRRPQLRDVLRLGKVHLEQAAHPRGQRQHVQRRDSAPPARLPLRSARSPRAPAPPSAGSRPAPRPRPATRRIARFRRLISVPRRKPLPDLHASPVPVHVAEPADIHQDVEPERRTRMEGRSASSCRPRWRSPSSMISLTRASLKARQPRRAPAGRDGRWPSTSASRPAPLPASPSAPPGPPAARAQSPALQQLPRRLFQQRPCLHQVGVRFGVLHQRRRRPHLARKQASACAAKVPQGLKPQILYAPHSARLKSCPDTKPRVRQSPGPAPRLPARSRTTPAPSPPRAACAPARAPPQPDATAAARPASPASAHSQSAPAKCSSPAAADSAPRRMPAPSASARMPPASSSPAAPPAALSAVKHRRRRPLICSKEILHRLRIQLAEPRIRRQNPA